MVTLVLVFLQCLTLGHDMELWEKIIEKYPEIKATDNFRDLGIWLRDDADGVGAYIKKWEYSKPIPDGLTLGKPE